MLGVESGLSARVSGVLVVFKQGQKPNGWAYQVP